MTSSSISQTPAPAPSQEIRLLLKGLGNPPSFKNKKRAILRKGATYPTLITQAKAKKWMVEAVRVIASQLCSWCQTTGAEITPECLRQFAMSSLPLDDAWQVLEIGSVTTKLVPKGEEGAVIEIRRTA